MSIKHRADSGVIFSGIIKLAQSGQLKTVRQVFKEMTNDDILKTQILPSKALLQISTAEQYVEGVASKITLLEKEASYLWSVTGGSIKDPADPWLIAVAATYDYCLVTNESRRKETRIPAACNIVGTQCRCISGPHFLYETGIISEFDPSHIDPNSFFGG